MRFKISDFLRRVPRSGNGQGNLSSLEVFPDAKYQRCTVHFYRNVFSVVPRSKGKIVAKMLKAIYAQESKAAKKVEDSVDETLTYADFPFEHLTVPKIQSQSGGVEI